MTLAVFEQLQAGTLVGQQPSEPALVIRLVCLTSLLALYCILAITTIAAIIYQHTGTADTLLSKRSMPLVLFQALAALFAGTLSLLATALHQYSCAIKLWAIYLGIIPWLIGITARAVQQCVLHWVEQNHRHHSLNLGQNLVSIDVLANNNKQQYISAETDIISSCYTNSPHANLVRPDTSRTVDAWSMFDTSSPESLSVDSLPYVIESAHAIALHRSWFARLIATRLLLWSLVLVVVILALFASVVTFTLPYYKFPQQQSAVQSVCRDNDKWVMWPAYSIALFCCAVVYPVLAFKMWSFKDPYGIRKDLFVCMAAAQLAAVLFVIWVTALDGVRGYISELFIVWVAALVSHIVSVCWPLWRSVKYQNHILDAKVSPVGLSNSFRGNRFHRSIYVSLYRDFNLMIEDEEQRNAFLIFANTYYHSAIPAFLADFQMLKYKTIEALYQKMILCSYSQTSSMSVADIIGLNDRVADSIPIRRLGSQLGIPRTTVQRADDAQRPHDNHPLATKVPITKGILESAILVLPSNTINQSTVFPEGVKSDFASFISTYFSKNSCMSINIPSEFVERVHHAIENNNVVLSVLDQAKDEVMFLLCTDVYAGYCKRLETQSGAKGSQ
ncbi:hypothetical protein LPJ66_007333 [Kickxella alabastrina]|uniref:Uncharacterized protein n=1 Tax=Kickxella alabastrina TaxID=61397 RepID=A0ACC1IAL0_9FUNG|nr:hypothetical protein LPJ66_007333 [Kickxella alabastrina]